jgi:hypothetical protein
MSSDKKIIFSTAYLPPVSYFSQFTKYRCIYIDSYENYIKQTYRNRCIICTANGKLSLSIPVIKTTGNHTKLKDIEIDYSQTWQKIHWRAIESAYSNSPFFLYYRDDFESFYKLKTKYLLDLNQAILSVLCNRLGIQCEINLSEKYFEPSAQIVDLRNSFSPKDPNDLSPLEYRQVFAEKHGFMQDLSIIDLLFNEGKYASDYL